VGVANRAGLILVIKPLRQRIKSSVHTRVGTIIVALAGISILEGAISTLPSRYQILALRSTFLLVVCLFPVILYYLFITTRKYSLLNEFITIWTGWGCLRSNRERSRLPIRRRHLWHGCHCVAFRAESANPNVCPEV